MKNDIWALIFIPVNILGKAAGNITLKNSTLRLAPMDLADFIIYGSILLVPEIVLKISGHWATQKITNIFSRSPIPKIIMNMGNSAKGLSFSSILRNGSNIRSNVLKNVPRRKPAGIPTIIDNIKPIAALPMLTLKCVKSSPEPAASNNAFIIQVGGGIITLVTRPPLEAVSQKAKNKIMDKLAYAIFLIKATLFFM